MESSNSSVTFLIKACPNHVLGEVVSDIETYGFNMSYLVTSLNVALDQASPSALSSNKDTKDAKLIQKNRTTELISTGSEVLFDHIIYMKTTGEPAAVDGLRSFVDCNLNAEYGIDMYCVEVRPRKYQTLFPLVFLHEEAPSKQEMVDLFSPFGKCTIRTKDQKMTYINYKSIEQVEAVLLAMHSSQLKFQHLIVHEGLFPVQNSKLMLLFDNVFNHDNLEVISSNCITKQLLTTWFNDVKKKASCEKTWDELADFLGERIWMRFGWTYNAEMEAFCAMPSDNNNEIILTSQPDKNHPLVNETSEKTAVVETFATVCDQDKVPEAENIHHPAQDATVDTPDKVDCNGTDSVKQAVEDTVADKANCTIFHNTTKWNTMMPPTNPINQGLAYTMGDGGMAQDGPIACEKRNVIVERMNTIPLYGDESHPLHLKLCTFEQQLFGKCEESNVCIHYRLMNMEIMMNINGENQPTSVRLTDLSYWIQQYMMCV